MVDMSPEAVSARLRAASELSRALVGRPGPQAVSMAPADVRARLLEWAELTRLCLALERDVRLPQGPEGDVRLPQDPEGG